MAQAALAPQLPVPWLPGLGHQGGPRPSAQAGDRFVQQGPVLLRDLPGCHPG